MNIENVQVEITKLVDPNRLNRQYPAGKKQLAELTELGLIDFMPICKHPSVKAIGHTDAKNVLEAAKDNGGPVGGFNADGEGDVVSKDASDLYKALHEVEITPEPEAAQEKPQPRQIARGMAVQVKPFVYAHHLEAGAVHTPPTTQQHPGYNFAIVSDMMDMEDGSIQVEVIVNRSGDVDEVPLAACVSIELDAVMTSAEIAAEFGIKEITVRQAIYRHAIPARQSGKTWLLRRADAVARWGKK